MEGEGYINFKVLAHKLRIRIGAGGGAISEGVVGHDRQLQGPCQGHTG